jgi:hypothetical protein
MERVADIILGQIRATDRMALFAWGTSKYIAYPSTDTHNGALSFEARNNPNFREKVIVKVELAYNDTYTIRLFKYNKEIITKSDVYCDQLVEVIDGILG